MSLLRQGLIVVLSGMVFLVGALVALGISTEAGRTDHARVELEAVCRLVAGADVAGRELEANQDPTPAFVGAQIRKVIEPALSRCKAATP